MKKGHMPPRSSKFKSAMIAQKVKIMATDIIDWLGQSGQTYRYWFLANPTAAGINAVAGNYAFVMRLPDGNYLPLYFGQADNLRDRIPAHERWDDAVRAGATHVMAHATPAGEQARLDEERDLIQKWNPSLNVHHRKAQLY